MLVYCSVLHTAYIYTLIYTYKIVCLYMMYKCMLVSTSHVLYTCDVSTV